MSSTIEYNRKVYVTNDDCYGQDTGEKNYLLLIKQGESNVYTDKGLRRRGWYFIEYGQEYSLWQDIGKRGGACEGGLIQRAKGWNGSEWLKIEDYIAIYRKAIRLAKPLETLLLEFTVSIYLKKKDEIQNEYARNKVNEMLAKYQFTEIPPSIYDKSQKQFHYQIKNFEELKELLNKYPPFLDSQEYSISYKFIEI